VINDVFYSIHPVISCLLYSSSPFTKAPQATPFSCASTSHQQTVLVATRFGSLGESMSLFCLTSFPSSLCHAQYTTAHMESLPPSASMMLTSSNDAVVVLDCQLPHSYFTICTAWSFNVGLLDFFFFKLCSMGRRQGGRAGATPPL
jgi:hypothetical protein